MFHFRWGKRPGKVNGKIFLTHVIILMLIVFLQVIEEAVEVGADSSQFPSNWIFHSREKKPGKAFVDGLAPDLHDILSRGGVIFHVLNAICFSELG